MKLEKNRAKVKQHLEDEILVCKIARFLHPCYHPKIVVYILKNVEKTKCPYFNEIMLLINMKMKMKINRYDINRPRARRGHKFTKRKRCCRMMMIVYIKQHLTNI